MKKRRGWSKRARAKGYYLERLATQELKNKGYYAIRIPTMLQVGELSKVDVLYCTEPHFVQVKSNKKNMSNDDKTKMLWTVHKYAYCGATAELAWRNNGSYHTPGLKWEYLQNPTKYRNRYKSKEIKK